MAVRRYSYRFPRQGYGFRGEHSREGLTDEIYQAGYLYRARNYHFVGRGRALKRQGHQVFGPVVSTDDEVQAIQMFEWGSTRTLFTVCDGKIFRYVVSPESWSDVTGAVSISDSADLSIRFTNFRDGSGAWLVGVSGGRPWCVKESGDAAYVTSDASIGPTAAIDCAEFMGRLFTLESDGRVSWSDDGVMSTWGENDGGYMYCTRESPAVGMMAHGQRALLIFHQRGIHAIKFTGDSVAWAQYQLDSSVGAVSADSIVHSKGVTYFLGQNGFYRITSPNKPAEYIGLPMEDVWSTMEDSRKPYVRGFVRGEPWNEVVWCASSTSSARHNTYFVFNTELQTWSVFTAAPSSALEFNCGGNWVNADGNHITLLGGYDGYLHKAWGDTRYNTGYQDVLSDGTENRIYSELSTGLLDLGYTGIKRLREVWIDLETTADKDLTLEVFGHSQDPTVDAATAVTSPTGSRFDVDLIFNTSVFGTDLNVPIAARFRVPVRAKMLMLRLHESNTTIPHTLLAMTAWYLPRATRFEE